MFTTININGLIIPVGPSGGQEYVKIIKTGEESFTREFVTAVRYVPLTTPQRQLNG